MPTTINGIGTMYVGRRNRSSSAGQCEFCGAQTTKSEYETTLFFTFLYIPLIPLGKKQVLEECALCRRHRVASAQDWGRLRDGQLEEARRAAQQADDSASLMELIQACRAFHRDDEAAAAVRQLEERFGKEPAVQFFLGSWYEDRQQPAQSHQHFREALRLAPGEWPYRRAVALCDLEVNDPASAAALLKDAEPPSPKFEPGLFVLLARGYQQRGQHDQAHRVLSNVLQASPTLAANKDFRQTMRSSEKALGMMQSAVPKDPIWRSRKFWVATAAVLLIAAIWGSNRYIKQHRTAYVVNGLAVPLTVVLDGDQELTVPARAWQKVTLAEGKHIAALTQPWETAAEEFQMEAGWFGRFFSTPAFVIDPAKASIVVRERAYYGTHTGEEEMPEVHVGQLFTQYDDVDYLFQEFPTQLQLKKRSKGTSKTRVDLIALPAGQLLAAALGQGLSTAERLDFLEVHLRTMPAAEMEDGKMALWTFGALAAADKQEARRDRLLRSRLADRPLLVEWHLAYQTVREGEGATEELLREYDALLAQSPGDAALLYLRGRIDAEPLRAMDFFEKSRNADPEFPHAWAAIAIHQNLEGQFAPALESLQKVVAKKPADGEFQMRLRDARFAAERFAELEQELKSERAADVSAWRPVEGLFEVYERKGDRAAAEALLTGYRQSLQAQRQQWAGCRGAGGADPAVFSGQPGGRGENRRSVVRPGAAAILAGRPLDRARPGRSGPVAQPLGRGGRPRLPGAVPIPGAGFHPQR